MILCMMTQRIFHSAFVAGASGFYSPVLPLEVAAQEQDPVLLVSTFTKTVLHFYI